MPTITGNATAVTLPKGGGLPTVTVDGQPTPIPINISLGLFMNLNGVTLNGSSTGILNLGKAWRADGTMTVTLDVDDNGISQNTDFTVS